MCMPIIVIWTRKMRYSHQSLAERISLNLRARSTLSFARSYIICSYDLWSCSSSGFSRRRGRPGCSSSPRVADFTLLSLVPTFIAICYRSFRQFVYVSLVFLLYTLTSRYLAVSRCCFYGFFSLFLGLLCSVPHILPFMCFSFRPGMFLYNYFV